MLYPTYLSSFTHLLKSDIRPISLLSVLRGDSSRSFFSTKAVVEPPPAKPAKPVIKPAKSVIKPAKSVIKPAKSVIKPATTPVTTPATARPATKPISITDRHSRAGTSCPVAAI